MAALTRAQARTDAKHDKAFAAAVNKAQEVIASEELVAAIAHAKTLPPMTPEELEAQVRSFAYGNLAIDRPAALDTCPDCSGYDGCHDVFCPRG